MFGCDQCPVKTEYPTLHVEKGVPRYFCSLECFKEYAILFKWEGPFRLTSLSQYNPIPLEDVPF